MVAREGQLEWSVEGGGEGVEVDGVEPAAEVELGEAWEGFFGEEPHEGGVGFEVETIGAWPFLFKYERESSRCSHGGRRRRC